jgi:riboflavin transporter FmnP
MKLREIEKIVLSGVFLALAIVLPFLTGQVQFLGQRFLPMHLPVLICGFICGSKYGLTVGIVAPILKSLITGVPPLYPVALAMAFELGAYGFFTGLLYKLFKKNIAGIYASLILAMLIGRVFLGIANVVLLGLDGLSYSFSAFIAGAFVNAVPGIIFQLVLVPMIIYALQKYKISRNYNEV